jgi:hypothetical protein
VSADMKHMKGVYVGESREREVRGMCERGEREV